MGDFFAFISCFGMVLVLLCAVAAIVALVKVSRLQRELHELRYHLLRNPPTPLGPLIAPRSEPIPSTVPTPEHAMPTAANPAGQAAATSAKPAITPAAAAPPVAAAHAAAFARIVHPQESAPKPAAPAPPKLESAPQEQPIAPAAPPSIAPPAFPRAPKGAPASSYPYAQLRPIPSASPAPAKPPVSLEQVLIRVAVGVGGLAFALAGIFLVKVAWEHNILNPAVRIAIGLAFGGALILVGVWRRTQEPNVAQALSAAGVADLFACFLAATNLHHLFPPMVGFVLLAATTGLAVILSLRQGPFVALLGLVGGFLTPALINTENPSALNLFGYLLLLHVGLIAVTRTRKWPWLAALTAFASLTWVFLWLVMQPWNPTDGPILGTFLLASAMAVAGSTAFSETAWHDNPLWARVLTYFTLFLTLALSAGLLARSDFNTMEWLFLALLSAGCFTLARLRPPYEVFAWLAAAFIFLLLIAWSLTNPREVERFHTTLFLFSVAFPLVAYGCLWGSAAPVRWAALSGLTALAFTLLDYFQIGIAPRPAIWAYLPLGVAAVYIALAMPVLLARARMRTGDETLTVLAAVILLALFFAPPMVFERAVLTAVWSAAVPLAALMATRLRLPGLLHLLTAFAVLVAARLLLNPVVLDYPTGPALFWNPLIWAYVPSLVAFVLTIVLMELSLFVPAADGAPAAPTQHPTSHLLEVLASLIALAFLTLFAHRIHHSDTLGNFSADFIERATYPAFWLPAAFAFFALAAWLRRSVLEIFGYVSAGLSILYIILVEVLLLNPLWTLESVGATPVWNKLLFAYGLPTLLIGLLAWFLYVRPAPRTERVSAEAKSFAQFATLAAIVLLFIFVSLEIRQFFQGPVLASESTARVTFRLMERASYPVLWLLLSFGLLWLGSSFKNGILSTMGYVLAVVGIAYTFIVEAIIYNPLWTPDPLGAMIILNHLLYVFGLPALLAGGLGVVLSRSRDMNTRAFAQFCSISAIALLFILSSLEVRHAWRGSSVIAVQNINELSSTFMERGTYPVVWMILAVPFFLAGNRFSSRTLTHTGYVFVAEALVFVLVFGLVISNPLWTPDNVGNLIILNRLLYAYGTPALLAAGYSLWFSRRSGREALLFSRIVGVVAIMLLFVLVSLEVRQGFRGAVLSSPESPTSAEMYAYSASWAVYGTLLLIAAILTHSPVIRWSSLLVMLLTTFKVFLFDTAHLSDVFRVLSFAGLGLSMTILGLLYHHFVFRPKPAIQGLQAAPKPVHA